MIEKIYGEHLLRCDICGGLADTEFETFQDAVDGKAELDWISQKNPVSNEWEDVCPDCYEVD